ncbi:chondroitinase-B domain-containing protein [Pedobacter arcticus]|uniref:chondroitinase-B domain-containing protein n=1 Tax=Pedobacter arcticus TaxID=752140 RepID=UPI0003607C78|nr:chondroitinase-B domain-containing protein [Pedobacter arcticus]
MKKNLLLSLACVIFFMLGARSQTAINTSFEITSYIIGNLASQNSWTVTTGNGSVSNTFSKSGTQSAKFSASGTALLANYIGYSGSIPGLHTEFYTDLWVKPVAYTTKGFAINAYDLFGASAKRIFVIDFTTDNKIRAYNGSSAVQIGTWTSNTWVRVSVKVDFATEKYYVALDGVVKPTVSGGSTTAFGLRESYTPTLSGTRVADRKEFHAIRINHGDDTSTGTTETYIDDLYVGTTAITGIDFGASSTARTITVTQPAFGTISLSPVKSSYNLNDEVTATLTLPAGYQNEGWTGDLSGTELIKTFTLSANTAFGATVSIDPLNPPAAFDVNITQPANGSITLTPAPTGGKYYQGTVVTAKINYEACYQFNNWTGDLSGNQTSKTLTVNGDVNIGADIAINNTPSVTRNVSTVTEFKNALASMNPGDVIVVEDGTYNLSSLTIDRGGCMLKPIVIKAKNEGGAILNGATALVLQSISYVTIQGFSFQSANIGTGIKFQNSTHVRITRNKFNIVENASCNWIYIGDTFGSTEPLKSGHNKIDYNIFDGKTEAGKFIVLDGNIDHQSQHDTISYNIFKNNGPRVANEKESIRVGVSTLTRSSGYTVIEHNLFEDCDGDPEIVSIKSCDNIVRFNTFRRCLGTLSFRQGVRNTAEGNYFFGEGKTGTFTNNGVTSTIGCGGIRVYGLDHKVFNNYFEGLTGEKWDAALVITNGDVLNSTTSNSSHNIPENVEISFNTLVNNKSNIEIGFDNGGSYPKAPVNVLLANNIVVGNTSPLVKSYSGTSLAGVSFANNMMYPTATASIGISASNTEINNTNPKLIKPACTGPDCELNPAAQIFRLADNSPAIDAATGVFTYVNGDFEQQTRTGLKDIGAYEYSGAKTINTSALTETYTGPNAEGFSYSYNYEGVLPVKLISFNAYPQLNDMKIVWQVSTQLNFNHYEVEWKKENSNFLKIGKVDVQQESNSLVNYSYIHQNAATGNNYYRLKIVDTDGSFGYSPIVAIKKSFSASVYPNPTTSIVNIELKENLTSNDKWTLTNSLGSVIKVQKASATNSYQFDLTGLTTGIYYLHLFQNGKRTMVHKIMKQ